MSKALVVVPTYNERVNLPRLVERLLALPRPVDVLVVDDNSPDGTGKLADELAAKNSQVHVLHRQKKEGLGRAYIAGFTWALKNGYDYMLEMDADFSHNPDDVPRLIEAVEAGADAGKKRIAYKAKLPVIWPKSVATPRTYGRQPRCRFRPALPIQIFCRSMAPTCPTVARQARCTSRTSPDGMTRWA